ncbi:MAG: copper homeostasis protein CutC [Pseudomonadota bacterium]
MSSIAIEVCVDNVLSLQRAAEAGADRIELCSALELGGLTPSAGFMLAATQVNVPVHAMIRPRAGDFEFTPGEVDQMIDDVRACREVGLDGVVIGASADRWINETALEALVEAAGGLSVTLHRVFDLIEDPVLAIDQAADLGIDHILTSGRGQSALRGIDNIRHYVELADDRLSIMAGGGIHAGNAAEIVQKTSVRALHGSFGRATRQYDRAITAHGFSAGESLVVTDGDVVKAVRDAVDSL